MPDLIGLLVPNGYEAMLASDPSESDYFMAWSKEYSKDTIEWSEGLAGPPIKSTGVGGMATDVQCQRTITVGESMAVRLVSSFTSVDSTASLQSNNRIFSFLVEANLVKLETSQTLFLPPR